MVRSPLLKRSASRDAFPFPSQPLTSGGLWGISIPFEMLSPSSGQVNYVLLTRLPLARISLRTYSPVRLACIRHAASVHPEPGSNSSLVSSSYPNGCTASVPIGYSLPRACSFFSYSNEASFLMLHHGPSSHCELDPQAGFCHFCGC
jgi:hypothetical protein